MGKLNRCGRVQYVRKSSRECSKLLLKERGNEYRYVIIANSVRLFAAPVQTCLGVAVKDGTRNDYVSEDICHFFASVLLISQDLPPDKI